MAPVPGPIVPLARSCCAFSMASLLHSHVDSRSGDGRVRNARTYLLVLHVLAIRILLLVKARFELQILDAIVVHDIHACRAPKSCMLPP